MTIRLLQPFDIEVASRLIESASDRFTRDDFTDLGYKKFKERVLGEGMRKKIKEGFKYWAAFDDDKMLGLIAIKLPAHLFNLFVHVDHHRKGVVHQLWMQVLSQLKPKSVTVYSSSYAVALYQKLGFVTSGKKIVSNELTCYPMLWMER